VGFRTKSLALIADAFHYLNVRPVANITGPADYTSRTSYAVALTGRFTNSFHRAKLVGAFFNCAFLLALALSIFLQSLERFTSIEPIKNPEQVMIIGCIGLCLNIIGLLVVHDHKDSQSHDVVPAAVATDVQFSHKLFPATTVQSNLDLVAVLIHLFGDAMNNVGIILAGTLAWQLHSPIRFYADPAVSLGISLIISATTLPTTIRVARILLEAEAVEPDTDKLKDDLLALPDVLAVHDLHVCLVSRRSYKGSYLGRIS
ncbi:cation efflux protein, partial [Mycena belliarum]